MTISVAIALFILIAFWITARNHRKYLNKVQEKVAVNRNLLALGFMLKIVLAAVLSYFVAAFGYKGVAAIPGHYWGYGGAIAGGAIVLALTFWGIKSLLFPVAEEEGVKA